VHQVSIFDCLPTDVLAQRFQDFHRENPHVYERLRVMALDLMRRGVNRYSIAGLFEVLRYEHAVKTSSDDGLKLNNNHRALYARLLETQVPALDGFFLMRERRSHGCEDQVVYPGDMPAPVVDKFDRRVAQ
jgi:hypothetical protein